MEPIKPGWKTTEFWLAALATVAGLLVASGAFAETSLVAKGLGMLLALLAQLGYGGMRTSVKNTASVASAVRAPAAAPSLPPR